MIMPSTVKILSQMGEQIKYARLRRGISTALVAERASLDVAMVQAVECGAPDVPIGTYAAVLHAVDGMDQDLLLIASDEQRIKTLRELDQEEGR